MKEETQPSDQELVTHALRDKRTFAVIVRRYEDRLMRYVRRLGCRDRRAAEDILQEIFIKVYIHLNDYDPSLAFSSWLYRIAHNETVSFFRKEKVRPRVVEAEEDLVIFENIVGDTDIAGQVDREHAAERIREAVGLLEPKYRDVFILKYFEEKSYEEISDILELPPGTVATLISRGKRKLRNALEKYRQHP